MDLVLIILYLLTLGIDLDKAVQSGADGPLWEARWRGLDPAGRARIATAAHSSGARKALTDPEDLDLLAGYGRRRRRRSAYVGLTASPILIVVTALALTGLVSTGVFGFVFAIFVLTSGLWNYLRERQMDGRLREVAKAEAVLAP